MSRKFRREVAVTIARPTAYFQSTALATIRDLRVVFTVERGIGKEPNKCDVEIYNLAETSRAELQTKPIGLRLDVGYDGRLDRLFEGDLRFCSHQRERTEWVTRAQVGDGDRAFRYARVTRAYRAGVSARDVVRDIAASMGLSLPAQASAYEELSRQFASGEALFGPAQAELSRVLAASGLTWSIQDGALQILRDVDTTKGTAVLISQDNGMIDAPDLGAPVKKNGPPVLTVKTLLNTDVKPGGKISVESRSVRGLYKVRKVLHQGDTHGQDFTTTIEGTPV